MKKRFLITSLAGLMVFIVSACTEQNSSKKQLSHGFSVDRNAVYYRDYRLDIDPRGFEVLSEHWVKNNTQVYFMFTPRNGQEIPTWLWSEGEDGDFYRLNILLGLFERPVDASSFELVTDYLAADKNQVYFFNARPPTKKPSVLRGADPGSIAIIDEHYARDENKVFYTHRYYGPCTIEQADPKTFTVLSESYSKDRNHAFRECALLEDADATTFRVMSGFLAADSKNVFRSGKLVSSADPATFSHLKHRFSNLNFYTDDKHVYYFRDIVEDADPETFEVIASYFSKDDEHAYFCSKKCHKIIGADVKTFRTAPVTSNWANARVYARDKNSVFFCAELAKENPCAPLADSDPDSFEYIGQYFSKDMSNVFFRETTVTGADAATFEIFEGDDHNGVYRARDKNSTYRIERVGAPDFYDYQVESGESVQ
jgi:hypothetical protein